MLTVRCWSLAFSRTVWASFEEQLSKSDVRMGAKYRQNDIEMLLLVSLRKHSRIPRKIPSSRLTVGLICQRTGQYLLEDRTLYEHVQRILHSQALLGTTTLVI